MLLIKEPTISQAHRKLINVIVWNHSVITTEDGESTWEYKEPIAVEIANPLKYMINPASSFQQARCDEYAKQIIEGVQVKQSPDEQFTYTYHERLFMQEQFTDVMARLTTSMDTRRVILYTWLPQIDNNAKDVPCLQSVHFIVREGKLNVLISIRSNDVLSAFGPNAYGFVRLQEHVANLLSLGVGTYTHVIGVAHMYPVRDAADLDRWMQ